MNDVTVENVESLQYLRYIVSQDDLSDEAIRDNVRKALFVITRIPRSNNVIIETKAKVIETTVIPSLVHDLETIVLRIKVRRN